MAWSKSTRITIMLVIDVMFFILELGVGLVVGSLALMADAFHMLNDIISLLVGLWAVKAAQKTSTDKYSWGYVRAEILGAFFNAVFLIALCFSIVMEAITRLIEPPSISNPKLILIVGSLGLASNLAGFFVLGGHGHSHGPESDGHDHDHDHDHGHTHSHNDAKKAEEGRAHSHLHAHGDGAAHEHGEESGHLSSDRQIKFTASDETASTSREGAVTSLSRNASKNSKGHHRRRTSSIRRNRLSNIEDLSIHPASFRQDIIAASRMDGFPGEETSSEDEDAVVGEGTNGATENSPLLSKGKNGNSHAHDDAHQHEHSHEHHRDRNSDSFRPRHDSWHLNHNHKKPKKASKGHGGHNHDDMGMRAMVLHVIGDALGNVGVIVAALIIWLTDSPYRFYADPAVSLFITLIILHSTIPLTTATAKILLQATPDHLDVNDIKEDIQGIPGVVSCHHVHIWQLSDSQIIASMHIQVSFPIEEEGGSERYMQLAKTARECLHAYGIHSATIQPEFCLDKAHNHSQAGGLGYDGDEPRGEDSDSCLLECVDDCDKGCCKPTGEVQHSHGEHAGHSH